MKRGPTFYYEMRCKNPLRKMSLHKETNLDYVNKEKRKLPEKYKRLIEKLENDGASRSQVRKFRKEKYVEHEKQLRLENLRTRIDEPNLILKKYGIRVYTDKYTSIDFSRNSVNFRVVTNIINHFVRDYRDIIPNRKPKIVITKLEDNPTTKKDSDAYGLYYDGWIYISDEVYDDIGTWIHEYAHYLTDRMSTQTEKLLKEGYREMLNEYFIATTGKKTRKRSLQGDANEMHRREMAKRLKLPDEYATTNFDEWFAVLIENWKNMPNNKHTYRFKKLLKKVLNRV